MNCKLLFMKKGNSLCSSATDEKKPVIVGSVDNYYSYAVFDVGLDDLNLKVGDSVYSLKTKDVTFFTNQDMVNEFWAKKLGEIRKFSDFDNLAGDDIDFDKFCSVLFEEWGCSNSNYKEVKVNDAIWMDDRVRTMLLKFREFNLDSPMLYTPIHLLTEDRRNKFFSSYDNWEAETLYYSDSPDEDIKSMKKWLAEVKAIFDKVDFKNENLYMTYEYVDNSEEKDN